MLNVYLFATVFIILIFLIWQIFMLHKEISRLNEEMKRVELERMEENAILDNSEDLNAYQSHRLDLIDERKEYLLDTMEERGIFDLSTREAADLLQISESTASRYLEEMAEEGQLTRSGGKTETRYQWTEEGVEEEAEKGTEGEVEEVVEEGVEDEVVEEKTEQETEEQATDK